MGILSILLVSSVITLAAFLFTCTHGEHTPENHVLEHLPLQLASIASTAPQSPRSQASEVVNEREAYHVRVIRADARVYGHERAMPGATSAETTHK